MGGMEAVLLSLHSSAAHKGQVEAWQADLKAFEELKNDCEDEMRRVRGEAYLVASLYAAFQTVILTAVSQASLLNCAHWWSPVSLSIAVCVASCLAIADKLYSIGEVQEEIKETGLYMSALIKYLDRVEREGSDLDLETAQPKLEYQKDELAGYRFMGSRDGISALAFLTGFSALIACFSFKTLCQYRCSSCSTP